MRRTPTAQRSRHNRPHPYQLAFAAVLGSSFATAATAHGRTNGSAADQLPGHLLPSERNTIEVFRRVSPSVVFITSSDLRRDFFSRNVTETPRGSGSGFVWDKHGHVVTNAHVIKGSDAISVTLQGGGRHRARVVGVDATKDLAVLRINVPARQLSPVTLGDSERLLVGQKVLAIGNPFGLDHTLTTGIISALGREIQSLARTTIQDVIQTDASINPGNSGGPLLDSRGHLVGINTAIYSPTGTSAGIGFAVPVGTVRRIVPQLIRYGHVKRAGLGVLLIPDDLARGWGVQGVVIRRVLPGSSAAKAALRSSSIDAWGTITLGDIIIGIDNHKVVDYDTLFTALDSYKPGDSVVVHYLRKRRKGKVKLQLQELR